MAQDRPVPDGRSIGLLGGSFNPAHEGHLAISLHALKSLKLGEVWWLVSPQNPLKNKADLADYAARLRSARDMAAGHRRIRVLDVEAQKNLRYSWQTVAYLAGRFPRARFVWLMGADNLAQFHRWRRWREILASLPVAVFDRVPFSHSAVRSPVAAYMRKFMLKNNAIIGVAAAPALRFVRFKRDPNSSTNLRKTLGKRAFLRHNKDAGSLLNRLH